MSREIDHKAIFSEIKSLIEQSRRHVAITVNASITLLYWRVGKRISEEIIKEKRAEYGGQVVANLSAQLTAEYGKGWSKRQLHHCLRFAEVISDEQIVHALRTQLSWTHIRQIIAIEDDLKRMFYIEMCKHEKWSSRTLRDRIDSMLFERTAISKKPEKTIKNELEQLRDTEQISPDLVFRDPYFLDFLGLKDTFSEKDLETAILAELQRFITEMGADFAFLARQKRLMIDQRDYFIDLLFYHRRLQCLVAIDLKIGEFDAAYKGEMELYLNYLEKHEAVEGENTPIGLILCSGKNPEHVELMQLRKSNIKIADYFTVLPPKEVLLKKLHQAIKIAKNSIKKQDKT